MDENLEGLARRYNFSLATVKTLAAALQASGGKLVQFNLPELGGMGQWMPGMTMIGDMFNSSLKARVEGLCNELAELITKAPTTTGDFKVEPQGSGHWWSDRLGLPATSGSQNDFAYAYFPTHHRLAIRQTGKVIYYDTGNYTISGVSLQQSGRSIIVFSGPQGVIPVANLSVVDEG